MAVIIAAPADIPVSRPLPLTVATVGALLVQTTVRPVSTFPLASLRVAVSCCAAPALWLTVLGVTVSEATAPVVVPEAMFERFPNTAFTFNVPRNATSSNW